MKKTALLKMAPPVIAASLLAVGCVMGPARPVEEVDVVGDPPAPLVEDVAPSPGIGFVWIGGAWSWHDRWVWEGGHWERPPRPGAVWVPHHYVIRNGHHVFIRGGWR